MQYKTLGHTGEKLSAIGLGCMGMSYAYGATDDRESIATLHLALESGVNFWDTADIYGNGKNEELIAQVLVPNRDKIFIATKFGFRFKENTPGHSGLPGTYLDASPAYIKTAVELSLKRLKIDTIDLYYAHRVDKNVPIEDTVGAMADLVKAGKVRYLGLSEASAQSLRRAHAVHPIAAVQSEYSVLSRDIEGDILNTTRELGISLVAYSPLARGLVTSLMENPAQLAADDYRRSLPRMNEAHLQNNVQLAKDFASLAKDKNISAAQLALAWVLAQGNDIIPIPGTKKRKYLLENIAATEIKLSDSELEAIDNLIKQHPNIGNRYSDGAMKLTGV